MTTDVFTELFPETFGGGSTQPPPPPPPPRPTVEGPEDLPALKVWSEGADGVWHYEGDVSAYETLAWRDEFLNLGEWELSLDLTDEAAELTEGRLTSIDFRSTRSTWGVVPHPSTDPDTGSVKIDATGVKAFARLGWDVAYPAPAQDLNNQPVLADTDPAPYKGPAETVIKRLVTENLVTRRGMHITVTPDLGRGSTVTFRPQFDNLLEVVQNLAKLGGIGCDLNLVNVGGSDSTRAVLTFDCWIPADKTKDVLLTGSAGTLDGWDQPQTEPTCTLAIVSGGGTGGVDRVRQVVTTPASIDAAARWGGHRVQMVDGPSSFDPDELRQAGEQAILDGAETRTLSLTAADVVGQKALRDYAAGDRATGEVVEGNPIQDVITSVGITVGADEGVTVTATFGDPSAADPDLDLMDQLGKLKRSIRRIEGKG